MSDSPIPPSNSPHPSTVAETFAALCDAPPNEETREILRALQSVISTTVDAVEDQAHQGCTHDEYYVRNWQSHMWWQVSDNLDILVSLVEKHH